MHTDAEILDRIERSRPDVVSVDAPLSLPRGRRSLDIAEPPHLRECDRELLRRRIRFFPVTLGPMRLLTARGMALRRQLTRRGYDVIESYPGAAQDILGIPRKGKGVDRLRQSMVRFGFSGDLERKEVTHDELDAVMCAYVGWLYLQGRAEMIGDPREGLMALPPRRSTAGPGASRSPGEPN